MLRPPNLKAGRSQSRSPARTARRCCSAPPSPDLLVGNLLTLTPAHAAFDCIAGPPPAPASPGPISDTGVDDSIVCVNTEPRTNAAGNAITLSTINANHYIYLNNSGILTATSTAGVYGIGTRTNGATSAITILNSADVTATSTIGNALGIAIGGGAHRAALLVAEQVVAAAESAGELDLS